MGDRRILTITARAGDALPAREPTEDERTYDARVLRWAVPALTEEEAARVIAAIPAGSERTWQGQRVAALLAQVFPDAEVRRG